MAATKRDYYDVANRNSFSSVATSSSWIGQTFTASESYSIESVKLNIAKSNVGDTPGNITLSLTATDVDGLPTGDDLASSVIDGDALDTGPTMVSFTFDSPYNITSGTKYAIFLRTSSATTNQIIVGRDSTSPSYSGGAYIRSTDTGSTWTEYTAYDLIFETWGSAVSADINLSGSSAGISSTSGDLFLDSLLVSGSSAGISGTSGDIYLSVVYLSGLSAGTSGAGGDIYLSVVYLSGLSAGIGGASGDFSIALPLSGNSVAESSIEAILTVLTSIRWPKDRLDDYDPDLTYKLSTETWVDEELKAGDRYKEQMVAVSEDGYIYFGAL